MGSTIIEKIMGRKAGRAVKPGDIITADVDKVMLDDIMMPFIVSKFKEMGFTKVWDPEKVVIICDHLVPASQVDDTRAYRISCDFAKEQGIPNLRRSDGICHQLMMEYVKPGDVVFGTDSHTTTYGCAGLLSTGIGYTEMAGILGTGKLWVRVPAAIKVVINGKLPSNVMSKDVILRIIGDIGAAGANYRAIEFAGDTIENMSMASRMTMSNMVIEAGAKCGIFPPDQKTADFLNIKLDDFQKSLFADEDAVYERVLEYKAEDFVPQAAIPSNVDNVVPVSQVEGIKVDQVFLGSCTNGRLEDLHAAAEILKGKHIAPWLRLIVTPASREIYRQALADGTIKILTDAGGVVTHPSCGLCCGRTGGILTDGEVVVATNNRNFLGRMGTNKVQIYLASPKTAAASAIEGVITFEK